MAVLEKRAGVHLSGSDAYVNVAGGIKVNEPALDLGIVMALVSSFKNRSVDDKTIIFGEVGTGRRGACGQPAAAACKRRQSNWGFETVYTSTSMLEKYQKN